MRPWSEDRGRKAPVAEMADAQHTTTRRKAIAGSNPAWGTKKIL